MLQFLETKFLLIDGHTAPQCFLCALFTRIWVTEHTHLLQPQSCPCTKMEHPQSAVRTDRESVFVSGAAILTMHSDFSFSLLFCPYSTFSVSGPCQVPLYLPGRNTSQGTTSLHFINKTYKEINGNLKATKICKNIYSERAKQVSLKDTLCCIQLRLHFFFFKGMVIEYMELMLFFL